MQLSQADIIEFKSLWKKETGKEITDEEAREYALDIIGLVELVLVGNKYEK